MRAGEAVGGPGGEGRRIAFRESVDFHYIDPYGPPQAHILDYLPLNADQTTRENFIKENSTIIWNEFPIPNINNYGISKHTANYVKFTPSPPPNEQQHVSNNNNNNDGGPVGTSKRKLERGMLVIGGLVGASNLNAISTSLFYLNEEFKWTEFPNVPPTLARYHHTTCTVNDHYLLVFGGEGFQEISNHHSKPSASSAAEGTTSAAGNDSSSSSSNNNNNNNKPLQLVLKNDLFLIDMNTKQASPLEATGDIPPPRKQHTAVILDGYMVIFGGLGLMQNSFSHTEGDSIDSNNNTAADDLQQQQQQQQQRQPGAVVVTSTASTTVTKPPPPEYQFLNDVYALNLNTKVWSKVPVAGNVPIARANHTATQISSSKFVIFGGQTAVESNNNGRWNDVAGAGAGAEERPVIHALSDVWIFSFDKNKCVGEWIKSTVVGGLPALFSHAAVRVKSDIYIMGGYTVSSVNGVPVPSRDVWTLNFDDIIRAQSYSRPLVASGPCTYNGAGFQFGRVCHTATLCGSRVIIVGGKRQDSRYVPTVETLNFKFNQ